jgi:hypothetical protein
MQRENRYGISSTLSTTFLTRHAVSSRLLMFATEAAHQGQYSFLSFGYTSRYEKEKD